MFDSKLKEKFYAAIWGFIVGDALGVPYEFSDRNTIIKNPAIGMIGYGSHNQPAGTWSDDSSMMLCVLENMKNSGTVEDLAKLFLNWYYRGYQTANGDAFDIGSTTLAALTRLKEGASIYKSGSSDKLSAGNGSLMRCVPYAFAQDLNKSIFDMVIQNQLTHKLSICNESCMFFVKMIRALAEGYTKDKALSTAVSYLRFVRRVSDDMELNANKEKFNRLFDSSFTLTHIDDIYSDGYVIHTLEAAVWCFMNNESYHDAVLQAVNCGGDTDTIAALTGALSATFYGLDNIPSDWKRQIRRHEELDENLKECILF
jgi:ADP-ribosyl-[dinitrogen reductase] hydrolase